MSELSEKMRNYGIDVAETMERFVEDEDLYVECLHEYLDNPDFDMLGDAIKTQDYVKAFDRAHTLKGVAGNMGLKPLFDVLCNIVEPLRVHDYSNLDPQYADVMLEREKVMKALY